MPRDSGLNFGSLCKICHLVSDDGLSTRDTSWCRDLLGDLWRVTRSLCRNNWRTNLLVDYKNLIWGSVLDGSFQPKG